MGVMEGGRETFIAGMPPGVVLASRLVCWAITGSAFLGTLS